METLLKLLKALEDAEEIEDTEFLSFNIPIVSEISRRAEQLLITKTGGCDWERIETLASHGYHAFPIERDSFGWLIGGIQTLKGVITYG